MWITSHTSRAKKAYIDDDIHHGSHYIGLGSYNSTSLLRKIKEAGENLNDGIKMTKRGHNVSLANRIKENPKAFYTNIKNNRVSRKGVDPGQGKGSNLFQEPEEKGEVSNEHFALIFTKRNREGCADVLEHIHIKNKYMLDLFKNIKVDKYQVGQ